MAYYDALQAAWLALSGSAAEKLAALNARTVAGPSIDVPVAAVVGHLMLSGAYLQVLAFAEGAVSGDAVHDAALNSAKVLVAMVTIPNAPLFRMSDPAVYAAISGMLHSVAAQETAAPGSTGLTESVRDGLLALCATSITWCRANGYPDAQNGGGGLTEVDLDNAGLS